MKKKKYYIWRAQGYTFVFAYDRVASHLLHIYARHLALPEDAVDTFFEPGAKTNWNEKYKRFETVGHLWELYWFWKAKTKKVVVVITCARIARRQKRGETKPWLTIVKPDEERPDGENPDQTMRNKEEPKKEKPSEPSQE